MARLILLRHAKAEPGLGCDQVRALTARGRRDAHAVGTALVAAELIPDLALVSSATRTRQTWEAVEVALGNRGAAQVDVLDALYGAGPTELLEVLQGVDARTRTMVVVGHEPTMSATAHRLAGPGSDPAAVAQVRAGLPTSTGAVLELAGTWGQLAPGAATLTAIVSGRA